MQPDEVKKACAEGVFASILDELLRLEQSEKEKSEQDGQLSD